MLNVVNLRKAYDTVVAVDGVSLEVQRGELFGLLGPNGAGKTTAIRTILNIIAPDSGAITFDGKPFTPAMWDLIGYLPEERGLYRKSKILNTILYFASLKGVSEREAKARAYTWLDRFGLKESAFRKAVSYTHLTLPTKLRSRPRVEIYCLYATLLWNGQEMLLQNPSWEGWYT